MAIKIDTSAWTKRWKREVVSGSGYWRFVGEGEPVGARKASRLFLAYETDGPWAPAKERALAYFRDRFGVTADVNVRLLA